MELYFPPPLRPLIFGLRTFFLSPFLLSLGTLSYIGFFFEERLREPRCLFVMFRRLSMRRTHHFLRRSLLISSRAFPSHYRPLSTNLSPVSTSFLFFPEWIPPLTLYIFTVFEPFRSLGSLGAVYVNDYPSTGNCLSPPPAGFPPFQHATLTLAMTFFSLPKPPSPSLLPVLKPIFLERANLVKPIFLQLATPPLFFTFP